MRFLQPAVFVLILLPFLDLFVLVRVGKVIGLSGTLIYLGLTVLVGLALCRRPQLMAALLSGKSSHEGDFRDVPVGAVLACMAAGGLLVLPGPLSDIVAILLLIPALRSRLLRWMLSRVVEGTRWDGVFDSEEDVYDDGDTSGGFPGATRDPDWPEEADKTVRDAEFELLPRDTDDDGEKGPA